MKLLTVIALVAAVLSGSAAAADNGCGSPRRGATGAEAFLEGFGYSATEFENCSDAEILAIRSAEERTKTHLADWARIFRSKYGAQAF
ncbi:MAG: hypothetical protein NDJ90_04425 [Oligoflexia bacterium]|nr:hypothetical protein [Oligoflexia bacterium]